MTDRSESKFVPKPRRPSYLVLALIALWFLAAQTVLEGLLVVRIVDNPLVGDTIDWGPELRDAFVRGIAENARYSFPLGVAQLLLGGLLVVLSVGAFFRAPVPVHLLLQSIAAYGGLVVLEYNLNAPVRAAMLQALVQGQDLVAAGAQPLTASQVQSGFQLSLWFHISVLALSAVAVVRPESRAALEPHKPARKGQ